MSEDELQLLDSVADEVEMDRLRKMRVLKPPEQLGLMLRDLQPASSALGGTNAYLINMFGFDVQGSEHGPLWGRLTS